MPITDINPHESKQEGRAPSAQNGNDRMDGRKTHYAQQSLTIGYYRGFLLRLSDRCWLSDGRTGVTLLISLRSPLTGLTTLTLRETLTQGFLLS